MLSIIVKNTERPWFLTRRALCVCPQQERLLLSILPKHIADEMLQDMKKEPSQKEMQQFNTMYMYRHENVRYKFTAYQTGAAARISLVEN